MCARESSRFGYNYFLLVSSRSIHSPHCPHPPSLCTLYILVIRECIYILLSWLVVGCSNIDSHPSIVQLVESLFCSFFGVTSVIPTTIGLCSSNNSFSSSLLFNKESALKYMHANVIFTLCTKVLFTYFSPEVARRCWGQRGADLGFPLPLLCAVCFCGSSPPPPSLKGSYLASGRSFYV